MKKLIDIDGTLEKKEKQKLLLVISQIVILDKKAVNMEYATNRYIDSIINSFAENKVDLIIPSLEIELYEY